MALRLLHVLTTVNPAYGGPVEGMRQLAAVNRRYGHVIEAVCADDPASPWLREIEMPVHALGPGGSSVYAFSRPLLAWLRENAARYDCLIVNGIWSFNALGTWLALRGQDVPYVVFTHGMLDPWFKHRYPLKHAKKWLYWPWGVYPVLQDADAVFFTCEKERALARESFWLYDCDEIVINYGTLGIPDSEASFRTAFLQGHPSLVDKRLFLFLGRVHPKKGPDLLIRAIGELQRAGEWDPATMRLVMAGPADSAYAHSLRQLATECGIEASIYWTGLIGGDVKWGAIQAAEVFVLPSHQENFGIAVAEALSAGTPVLISHAVNISPEIGSDRAGIVAEDTVAGCAGALREWLGLASHDQTAMRRQARSTFLERYTAAAAAKDLLKQIYLALLARRLKNNLPTRDGQILSLTR